MEWKEFILAYLTFQGFMSYVPQIIKVIRTKSSKDLSVGSWFLWLSNSILYLVYLLLEGVGIWLLLSQLLEVFLISFTFIVVVIFRNR